MMNFKINLLFAFSLLSQVIFPQVYWQQIGDPINGYGKGLVVDSAGNIFVGIYLINHGGIYASYDGINWERSDTLKNFDCYDLQLSKDNTIYAATNHGVLVSNDSGKNWTHKGLAKAELIAFNSKETIYTTALNFLFRSTDFAGTWENIFIGMECRPGGLTAMAINPNNDDVWLGSSCDAPYRLFNNDSSFERIEYSGLYLKNINSIVINKNGAIFISRYSLDFDIFHSSDNGKNWDTITAGNTTHLIDVLQIDPSDNIYAGSQDGIFRSNDNGKTWENIKYNLKDGSICDIAFDRKGYCYLTIHDETGINQTYIYKSLQVVTTATDKIYEIPTIYLISQNYPNPFNPVTKIKYQIPQTEFVTIKVYNILGREVATLVNEQKPASTNEITWNAAGLSSGVYFYTLKAGEFIESKKMVLLR